MSRALALVLVLGLTAALAQSMSAQSAPAPTIHRVTLNSDTGVLTIAGTGLGSGLHVTVDGQPVTVLSGASDTQVEVQAPVSLLTVPGTYRLTVVDPVRQAWDGFVVAGVGATPVAGAPGVAGGGTAGAAGAARGASAGPDGGVAATDGALATSSASSTPLPLTVIEDSGSPYRTAVGANALNSNTTGTSNTAAGYNALTANTSGTANTAVGASALLSNTTAWQNTAVGNQALRDTATGGGNTAVGFQAMTNNTSGTDNVVVGAGAMGQNDSGADNVAVGRYALFWNTTSSGNSVLGSWALYDATGGFNTAIGYRAGRYATTGAYNIFVGAHVEGTTFDANTIRIGSPYASGTGQNRTFIAGIRDTTVSGGEAVYINASGQLGSGPVVPAVNTVGSAQVIADSLTAADLAPASVTTSELADGSVTAAKVGFAFAGLGANIFAGTQTIGSGNLDLAPSSSTAGSVTKNGVRFLHDTGSSNTFLGDSAGNFALTGGANTGTGDSALQALTSGGFNVASGAFALLRATTGAGNTAVGYRALTSATTGSSNTSLGRGAGGQTTTGSYNIYLGADVGGTSTDANTIRLGLPYDGTTSTGQNKTFIAGIAGTVLTTPAVQVFVDANGQLGTLTPPPITGTINSGVTPGASPPVNDALVRRLDAQDAVIAELRAELARLRAQVAERARRR